MFHTDLRRSNDDHLHEWAKDVGSRLKQNKNYSIHYIGYGQFDFDQDVNLIEKICSDKNVIVFCFDFLLQETIEKIVEQVEKNSDVQLVWIGAQKNVFKHRRIYNMFWPGDVLLQIKEYGQLPIIEKNPSEARHWISTSLGIRQHRIYMASLLQGLGLDDHGDLRIKTVSRMGPKAHNMSDELTKGNGFAPDGEPSLNSYVQDKWKVPDDKISEDAIRGYGKLIKKNWWGSSIFTYSQYSLLGDYHGSNDAGNFDKYLRHLYKDKTLEIVNETCHGHDPVFITEKFTNAVFGMNFIVMNGSKGTIRMLEDLGWNSCRHIINHDYDDIEDPINRCEQAIRLNYKLFSEPSYCNQLWSENLPILEDNRTWAKEKLYEKVLQNCQEQLITLG
jgi:hypothetical protein|tara:strand:- start:3999 stop:5165 length:1167 start_codon:yes stop_codon:yes gene_type:complete